MRKRIPLFLSCYAVLVLVVFFTNIFITYAQPMRSDQLDLSLSVEMDEINSVDRCDTLGWTIYTQEGDVVTPWCSTVWAAITGCSIWARPSTTAAS